MNAGLVPPGAGAPVARSQLARITEQDADSVPDVDIEPIKA
jgi:hypothetical protein